MTLLFQQVCSVVAVLVWSATLLDLFLLTVPISIWIYSLRHWLFVQFVALVGFREFVAVQNTEKAFFSIWSMSSENRKVSFISRKSILIYLLLTCFWRSSNCFSIMVCFNWNCSWSKFEAVRAEIWTSCSILLCWIETCSLDDWFWIGVDDWRKRKAIVFFSRFFYEKKLISTIIKLEILRRLVEESLFTHWISNRQVSSRKNAIDMKTQSSTKIFLFFTSPFDLR